MTPSCHNEPMTDTTRDYVTSDFARCADCERYYHRDDMVDVDGDGAVYCHECSEALLRALAFYAQPQESYVAFDTE